MEWLKRECNEFDWVGLYSFDKLSSLRVDKLSFSLKITFNGKKAEKVAMIKAHIDWQLAVRFIGVSTTSQPPLRNLQQQVTSSLSEVKTDSQSDIVDRVVGSSPRTAYQNPARKHYRRRNMDESGHGSRETILLVGTR